MRKDELTVDYKDLLKSSTITKSGSPSGGNRAALSLLNPSDLAGNFPSNKIPGGSSSVAGGGSSAMMKGLSQPNSSKSGGAPKNKPSGPGGSSPGGSSPGGSRPGSTRPNSTNLPGGTPRPNNRPTATPAEPKAPWVKNMEEGTVPKTTKNDGKTSTEMSVKQIEGSRNIREDLPVQRGVPASVRYNNPGAQYPSPHAEKFGMTGYGIIGGGHKIANFPSASHGAASNMDLFSRSYVGMTIKDAATKWRGGNGTSDVAGFDGNTKITPEMAKDPKFMVPFMKSMAGTEAGKASPLTDTQWQDAFRLYQNGGKGWKDEGTTATPVNPLDGTKANTAEGKLHKLKVEDVHAAVHATALNQQTASPDDGAWKNRIGHEAGAYESGGIKLNPKLQHVMNEAAKDLPEGYTVKMTSGVDARSTGTKNHPNGLAMDVRIFDKDGKAIPNNRNSPGWKEYEKLYRSANIRGKELYPDEKFIWGGAWQGKASGNGDPMHYQIVKPVSGSSQSSGRYSFEGGLDKRHDFYKSGNHLNDQERASYDTSIREKLIAERKEREAKQEGQKAPPTPPQPPQTPSTDTTARPVSPEPVGPKKYNYKFDINKAHPDLKEHLNPDGSFGTMARMGAPYNKDFQKLPKSVQADLLAGKPVHVAAENYHKTLKTDEERAKAAEMAKGFGVDISEQKAKASAVEPPPALNTAVEPPPKPKDLDQPAAEAPKSTEKDADSSSRNADHKSIKREEPIPEKKEEKKEDKSSDSDKADSSDAPDDEAYGGQINKIDDPSRLSSMPLRGDKRGTSGREDTAILYDRKVKAYINRNEDMSYDSGRKQLSVTPTQRTRADSILERNKTIRHEEPPKHQPEQPKSSASVRSVAEQSRNLREAIMQPPTSNWGNQSTERAYTRSKFFEPGDHVAGYHFNSGASNFRSS